MKLDDRSQTMIFMGNHSTSAYKLLSHNENKAIISKDVQFDENKGCNWLQVSNNPMQNGENSSNVRTILQEDQVAKVV